jgi:hypothetical protein
MPALVTVLAIVVACISCTLRSFASVRGALAARGSWPSRSDQPSPWPHHSLMQGYAEGRSCARATSRCDINMTPEPLPEVFQTEPAGFSLEHLRDPSHLFSHRYRRSRRHLLQMAWRLP